jgi:hypothetical protein
MAGTFCKAIISAMFIASPTWAADPHRPLMELPVIDMKPVDPADYAEASTLAASGASPIDIALKIAGKLEAATQHIVQMNDRGEAPSRSRVTVLRDGLLDDSIRGERWDIALEKTPAAAWKIGEVKRAWRCRRGEFLDRFTAASCP